MYSPQNLEEIKSYRPARLATGKEWFVEYYVYHIETKRMVRKKIMLNHIEKITERRTFAHHLMRKLNAELEKGWNPYIADENARSYTLLTRAMEEFSNLQQKKHREGSLRDASIHSYDSYAKRFSEYLVDNKLTDLYVFHFNKEFVIRYLDYFYNEKNLASRTRDNYLKFLRLFSNYLVDRDYIKVSPADKVAVLGKGQRKPKNRTILPVKAMQKVSEYLNQHNKHFLLAAQILYFCMVRPKEMSYIQIKHINLKQSTIFIPGETSKNYENAIVTIPETLGSLMAELKITDYSGEYYLFSHKFKPGKEYCRQALFGKYWDRYVRKDLKLPLSLKFYSLKDTGITDMIREYKDPLIARDQARHHDLSITNMYTPSDMMQANETIKNDTRKF